ncbi:M20 family metallopeptidase [Phyllobacterium sp. SB3]|uniref:M20 family metallopeptidase n=1 Tax=Phyllobacterium sp. SB3 TaxID=3156073 RepID=UPI0032B002FF
MKNTDAIWDIIDGRTSTFTALSDEVWDAPELSFQEKRAAQAHRRVLETEGFRVEAGVADIPTALCGQAGEGSPVIAILGEFDALPGLSQKAGTAVQVPLEPNGSGHGCGHNMLGSASLLAATAVKEWLSENNVKGTVRYYACPAEEGGSAKGFMVRNGVFDDVDIAICWHPAPFTGVNKPFSLACVELEFVFSGRASHAAAAPHLGRSALDAVELMNVGVNYLREHMPPTARMHYALIDGGGVAPNVVQARAVVRHLIRAATLSEMWSLVDRVRKVAHGAAMMTETQVTERQLAGDANLVGNETLESAMDAAMRRLGPVRFDEEDKAFAARIQETLSREDIVASYRRFGLKPKTDESLSEDIYPLGAGSQDFVGSTDVGTVSWVVPTVQCRVACYAVGTPGHSWQLVAQGKSPAAHKGMIHAAKIMAATAVDLLADEALIHSAKAEHGAYRSENDFANPIGPDVVLDLNIALH